MHNGATAAAARAVFRTRSTTYNTRARAKKPKDRESAAVGDMYS